MNDYELGTNDAQSGIPAQENASDEYIEGYGLQYECDDIPIFNLAHFDAAWAMI